MKLSGTKNIISGLIVVAVLFLAFAPDSLWSSGVAPPERRTAGGDFILQTLDGGSWSLGAQRGRVVLVNYWATWCAPCRAETPALVRLSNEYKAKGLEVVGITLDEGGATTVRPFVAEYGIPYPILLPTNAANLSMMIEAVPTTVLYDRQGRVAMRYVGAASESVLRKDVEQLLAEQQ